MSSFKLFKSFTTVFLITAILNLVTLKLYSYYLKEEDLSTYTYIQSFILILSGFFTKWICQSIYKFNHRYINNSYGKEYNGILLIATCIVTILAIVVVLTATVFLLPLQNYVLETVLITISFFYIDILNTYLQTNNSVQIYFIGEILRYSLRAVIPLLIYLQSNNTHYFLLSITGINFLFIILQVLFQKINFSFKKIRFQKVLSLSILKYGLPVTAWFFLALFLGNVDRIFIANYIDFKDVGNYAVNVLVISFLASFLSNPLLTTLHPILLRFNIKNHLEAHEVNKQLNNVTQFYWINIGLFSLLVVFVSAEFMELIFGAGFKLTDFDYLLIVASSFFWNLGSYGNKPYELEGNTRKMIYPICLSVIAFILLSLWLTPLLGISGILLSKFFSNLSYPLILFYKIKHDDRVKIKWELFNKVTLKGIMAGILLLTIMMGLSHYLGSEMNLVYTIVCKAVFCIIILCIYYIIFFQKSFQQFRLLFK